MAHESTESSPRDARVEEVLAAYLEAVRAGGAPDRAELLARNPDLADELRSFFADDDLVRDLAEPLRRDTSAARTPSPTPDDTLDLPPAALPRRFGDYEILEVIARAGMGVVYRARQISLDRVVALKMVQPGCREPEDLERFLHTEARAVAGLDHPHIVPVYDFGTCEGRPFFSMKLIEGGSLDRHLARFANDPKAAARLVATAARAVHHAHQRGLLHRDLKPANILLDAGDRPLVTDFGLAKRVEGDSGQTQQGTIVGTPAYMAPEQAAAEPVLTTAVDVYGLGAVLYELLTGRPPFRAATPLDTLIAVRTEEPARPSALDPKADRDLETVCLKCLEKDPARRYGSAEALADDLDRWLRGEPILARRTGTGERAAKWVRRQPAVAVLLGGVLLVAAAGLAGVLWQWRAAVAARGELEVAAQKSQEARALAERSLHFNRLTLAEREWRANNVGRACELLALCPLKLRHWEWHYLNRLCHSDVFTPLAGALPQDTVANRSPDLRHWIIVSPQGSVMLWDSAAENEPVTLGQVQPSGRGGVFSGDGTLFALADGKAVRLWRLDGERRGLTLRGHAGAFDGLTFSGHGRHLAAVGGGRDPVAEVMVWDTTTGQEERALRIEAGPESAWRLSFGPDGQRLDLVTTKGQFDSLTKRGETLTVWDTSTGRQRCVIPTTGRFVGFSPDGKRLLTCTDRAATVWDGATGKKVFTASAALLAADWGDGGVKQYSFEAAFSLDGRRLALGRQVWYKHWDGDVRLHDAATGKEIPLQDRTLTFLNAAFSPDGGRLAAGSREGTIKVWDAATGRVVHTLYGHSASVFGVQFSPDGRRLASGSADQSVKLWDAATGKELRTFRGHALPVDTVAFSPNGRRLNSTSVVLGVGGEDKVWDAEADQEFRTARLADGDCRALAFSPNGRYLACGGTKGTVRLSDARTGEPRLTIACGGTSVYQIAFSPDSKYLVTCAGEVVRVWAVADGSEALQPPTRAGTAPVHTATFSPDGTHLLVLSRVSEKAHEVRSWDVASGQEVSAVTLPVSWLAYAVVSPDGRRLAALTSGASDARVRVWELATGEEVLQFAVSALTTSLVFTPDGKRLVTEAWKLRDGNTATFWDAATGEQVGTFRRPLLGSPAEPAVSPDGRRLATGGGNEDRGELTIWDTASGEEALTLRGFPPVLRLAYSPDGNRLAAACNDGQVRVWDGTPVERPPSRPAGALEGAEGRR